MAALTDDVVFQHDANLPLIIAHIKGAADTYFRGSVLCVTAATGVLDASPADADKFVGVCLERVVAAANDFVRVGVMGRFLFVAATMVDANIGEILHPLVASDNPADMVAAIAAGGSIGNPTAAGLIDQVTDTANTTGWLNTAIRHLDNT